MKETRMPPVHSANLLANSGYALHGVYVISHPRPDINGGLVSSLL